MNKKILFIIDGSHWKINLQSRCFKNSKDFEDNLKSFYQKVLEDWVKSVLSSDKIHQKWQVDAEQDAKSMIIRKEREGLELKSQHQFHNFVNSIAEPLAQAKQQINKLKEILSGLGYNTEIKKFKLNEKQCANPQCICIHKAEPIISNVQCGVDTFITAKMVEMACTAKVNTIVLLSGDGDFQSAIQIVKEYNVNVIVVGTNIAEMLRSDKNIKCIEIPDVVFSEIKNLLSVPEQKQSPSKFIDSNLNLKEKVQSKKNKTTLNKKESNPQSKDVTGLLFKDNNLHKSKNGINKVDMSSNSNSGSHSEHEVRAEETHGRSDQIQSDKFNQEKNERDKHGINTGGNQRDTIQADEVVTQSKNDNTHAGRGKKTAIATVNVDADVLNTLNSQFKHVQDSDSDEHDNQLDNQHKHKSQHSLNAINEEQSKNDDHLVNQSQNDKLAIMKNKLKKEPRDGNKNIIKACEKNNQINLPVQTENNQEKILNNEKIFRFNNQFEDSDNSSDEQINANNRRRDDIQNN